MKNITSIGLQVQYKRIKNEIDQSILNCVTSTKYINGPQVKNFQKNLEKYLNVKHVIPCGNGTDALQISLMSLGLQPGDEVIVPVFTYVATAEVIALLGLKPVMVDVDQDTFNISLKAVKKAFTKKTKAIVPVHLFGQCADMEPLKEFAQQNGLHIIEDAAQAIGSEYIFSDGSKQKAGTIGDIGCTSFFPSKNLGCFGDGGAMYTNDDDLAVKLRKIANHGQAKKYYHDVIGVNSRLDSIQAAVLDVKLKYLDQYNEARQKAAVYYDQAFSDTDGIEIPKRSEYSTHVFHQYTIKVDPGIRDGLKEYLKSKGIPSMIYYPVPLHLQEAYKGYGYKKEDFPVAEMLCERVLSLPMHTELDEEQLGYIGRCTIEKIIKERE